MTANLAAVYPLPGPQKVATAFTYRLVPCHPPPAFDPKPMLKTKLLWGRPLKIYNAVFVYFLPVAFPLFWLGSIFRIAAFFVFGTVGDIVAIISVLLQFPSVINMFIGSRIEFIRILFRSYDYCFYHAVMTVFVATFGTVLHNQPLKLVMLPVLWFELSNGLNVDACLMHNIRTILWAALSSSGFVVVLVVGVVFGRIAGADHHEIVLSPSHAVGTQDILSNAMITQLMLFMRLIYNSKVNLKHDANNPSRTAIQCRMVRCPLRWELVQELDTTSQHRRLSSMLNSTTTKSSNTASGLLELTPKASHTLYDADVTLFPKISSWILPAHKVLWPMASISSMGGVITTIACFTTASPPEWLAITAQVLTLFSSVIVVSNYQPRVFQQIVNSFNFIFLSTQLSVSLLCLCDAFRWETYKVLGIVNCWLWLHLILTIDAMTPVMKSRLRFKLWFLLPAILLALIAQVVVIVEIVWSNNWHLQNRVIWQVEMANQHKMVIHSASLLLGRLLTLVVSFSRLFYVIITRSCDDELFLLQCPVEYDYRGWKKTRTALDSVEHGTNVPRG